MIALTLEIAAIAILLMVAAFVYVFRQAARAPQGFENLDSFHFGTEPHAQAKARGWNRAVVPAIVTADDQTMPIQIHHVPPAQAAL
jgi:hypothetical protein